MPRQVDPSHTRAAAATRRSLIFPSHKKGIHTGAARMASKSTSQPIAAKLPLPRAKANNFVLSAFLTPHFVWGAEFLSEIKNFG